MRDNKWSFAVINASQNYRAALGHFKYTAHYVSNGDPMFSPAARVVRGKPSSIQVSAAAMDRYARGLTACFIDPAPTVKVSGPSDPALGTPSTVKQTGDGSQPWVMCPLYGCCCGGDECHTLGTRRP